MDLELCHSDDEDDVKLLDIANDATIEPIANNIDNSGTETITLSGGISYNPSKYGGMESLIHETPSGHKIVRSGSRTAAQKYAPYKYSATSTQKNKCKKNLFPNSNAVDSSYTPYYVLNFEYIVKCVIDFSGDRDLFSDDDLEKIKVYRSLSLNCRKLYCRLLNRKDAWIPRRMISYDDLEDVELVADELVNVGLFQGNSSVDELSEALDLLSAGQIKQLGRVYNVSKKITTKFDILVLLLNQAKVNGSIEKELLKRTLPSIGPCYRLEAEGRSVMMRILCLYGILRWWENRAGARLPSNLTKLLLVHERRANYPEYSIERKTNVFRGREDVVLLEEAVILEERLQEALAYKDWDRGYLVYVMLKSFYGEYENDLRDHVKKIPSFLRRFTAPAVAVYGLSKCVDLLEKMKRYEEAVDLLESLLSLELLTWCRGGWWERITLDLEQHLKNPKGALDKLETALQDQHVTEARRWDFCQRVLRICNKNGKFIGRLVMFRCLKGWIEPWSDDLPTVTVLGKLLRRKNMSGAKSVFVVESGGGGVTYCNVEELVRSHYREAGYSEGVHGETAVFGTLLAVVFWDIIYGTELSDVFRGPAQSAPLDWDSDEFYESRKEAIEDRLKEVAVMSRDEVVELILKGWEKHAGVMSIAGWYCFMSGQHLASLVKCILPKTLCDILGRLVRDHRAARSGFPDLTVWNPDTREVKVVEVKGPTDRMSSKQILWIKFLNKVGIKTEVCYVKSSKKLSVDNSNYSIKKRKMGTSTAEGKDGYYDSGLEDSPTSSQSASSKKLKMIHKVDIEKISVTRVKEPVSSNSTSTPYTIKRKPHILRSSDEEEDDERKTNIACVQTAIELFISACQNFLPKGEVEHVLNKLRKYMKNLSEDFISCPKLKFLIEKNCSLLHCDKDNIYVYVKNVLDELKKFKKRDGSAILP